MDLRSQSWEYASEMVLKSVHMRLRTAEVPIRFLKDREGRLSHHKRSGWFSPWHAAWINLRAMFVYGADFFLFKPGLVLLVAGAAAHVPALVRAGHRRPDHVLAALDAARRVVGDPGPAVRVHGDPVPGLLRLLGRGDGEVVPALLRTRARWSSRRRCSRSAWSCGGLLTATYFRNGLRLPTASPINNLGFTGLFLDDRRVHDLHLHAAPALDGRGGAAALMSACAARPSCAGHARHARRSARRLAVGAPDPAPRPDVRRQAGRPTSAAVSRPPSRARCWAQVESAVLVDVALADDLQADPSVHAIEGRSRGARRARRAASLDVVMLVSVLEHV